MTKCKRRARIVSVTMLWLRIVLLLLFGRKAHTAYDRNYAKHSKCAMFTCFRSVGFEMRIGIISRARTCVIVTIIRIPDGPFVVCERAQCVVARILIVYSSMRMHANNQHQHYTQTS